MIGFSEQFSHYLPPTEEQTEKALKRGLVVLDANVLLSAYRFAPDGRDQLLSVLESLKTRVWVPHQAALEFHRRRFQVLADQLEAYDTVLTAIKDYEETRTQELLGEIQRLTNRVNLSPKVKEQFQELTKRSLNELRQKVETLRNAHTLGASRVEDPILTRLQLIFDRKVGSPLPTTEHSEAEKEAQRRIEAKVPPGYKDAEKSNPHGDYLVWAQALNEAQKRGVETTIFVTEDRKEDWYERVNGEIVGPRPELVEEAYSIANTRLQLMPIRSLFHHAAKHLNAKVSNETLLQAERLPERSRFRRTIAHTDGDKRLTQLDRQIHELYDEAKRIEHTLDVVRSASTSDPTDTQVAEHVAILTQNLARVVKRISHLKRRRDDLGEIMIRNFNAATHGFTQDPDTPMSSDSDTTMDEYRRMLRKRLEDMDTDYLE